VQYFILTRKQLQDLATQRQWRKEVPPNSYVLDTGFNGQIFKTIAKIDSTHSFRHIESNVPEVYPALLDYTEAGGTARSIEYLPKLISRPTTYTEYGRAVYKLSELHEDEDSPLTYRPREEITSFIRETMRDVGLSEWHVWRYARFTGVTPQERLGVVTKEEVAAHYQRVAKLRS
jgi:hypothetical protein